MFMFHCKEPLDTNIPFFFFFFFVDHREKISPQEQTDHISSINPLYQKDDCVNPFLASEGYLVSIGKAPENSQSGSDLGAFSL